MSVSTSDVRINFTHTHTHTHTHTICNDECNSIRVFMCSMSRVWSVVGSNLIFLRKSDCLGCAVLLCFVVCLTLLASFFLPSHLSYLCVCVCVCVCALCRMV